MNFEKNFNSANDDANHDPVSDYKEARMKGWLVVNSFVDSEKFKELYFLLLESAKKQNITLELVKGSQLISIVGSKSPKMSLPDFCIFWDKDIMLAKALENMGVRLFNSSDAISFCDNKALTYLELAKVGIKIPETVIAPKTFEGVGVTNFEFLKAAVEKLGLPIVIKEAYGSFGQQVYLAHTEKEAEAIIKTIGHKEFVFQKFISSSYGKDVRINVVGEQVKASMLRYNANDFRSNISNGGSMEQYTPSDEQKHLAIAAVRALKLDFAGVDIMFGPDDEPIVCEVNSNPHFKSTLDCTGINLADDIIEYIVRELK